MREEAARNLKRACRLTGARWAALVSADRAALRLAASWGLSADRAASLQTWLSSAGGIAWFRRLANAKQPSESKLPTSAKLGVRRVFGYSGRGSRRRGVVVGADAQRAGSNAVWLLLAEQLEDTESLVPRRTSPAVHGGTTYDATRALEGMLADLLRVCDTGAGWLAIRRGDQLVIAASTEALLPPGTTLDMRRNELLATMWRQRASVVARKGPSELAKLPHKIEPRSVFWAAFPLVMGDRFIGAMATWGRKVVTPGRIDAGAALVQQASQNVDMVVTLEELTNQLRRLATVNEFALAISSAEGLPSIATRVLDHISSIFPEKPAALLIPDLEGRWVLEFKSANGKIRERRLDATQQPWLSLIVKPSEDGARAPGPQQASPANTITFPLRYRESVVGALAIEDTAGAVLSRYDQSMLAVVASYIAGVVEHGRLRADALERAERLEQTVHRLREAELTASARLQAQQAAETRLLQAAKLVAVGEMAAGVAHELNNPLTTVAGFAELVLDETPADAPYRADLEMVLHEAHRARSVVRRLLDFARQGERARARADINEIVDDVLALMTHYIHTSGVQLDVHLEPGLPWIAMDGNQMKQVLLNLLHNALHAMPSGGHLDVRTELQKKGGRDWIVIHVVDSGKGMEPQELERIFEPFYTTRSDSGGTGLGLSVTYGIVSEHGGTIEVKSQRGGGSTFSVWLPA